MRLRRIWLLPFLLCLGATKCNTDADLGPETDVAFETLEYIDGNNVQGDFSGIVGKRLEVVRDVDAFTQLWSDHAANRTPVPEQPDVAFGTDMVIAVFAGQQATGGYSITVDDIRENDEFIIVDVEVETPGKDCVVSQAQTQPHHFVVLDDSDKVVEFNETVVQAADCTTT